MKGPLEKIFLADKKGETSKERNIFLLLSIVPCEILMLEGGKKDLICFTQREW